MNKFPLLFLLLVITTIAQSQTIRPGAIWPDNNSNHIQAHGGAIIQYHHQYYWYGETYDADTVHKSVNCYNSKDLIHWTYKGKVLTMSMPDTVLTQFKLERPKVFYNVRTRKFVLYMHLDGVAHGSDRDYSFASVGVALSNKPAGPFKFIRAFRPLGDESRDIGQFIDDDGTAYLIFEDRPSGGFHIARLSADYLDVQKEAAFIKQPMEGGAIVHYHGLYYVIGSHLTGWSPNPNQYATARSISGPWSIFKDIAPPQTNTYNSQSSFLLKIAGSKSTTVIFMADQWKPDSLWDSRYLWMPLRIGDGQLALPAPKPWAINLKTGVWK